MRLAASKPMNERFHRFANSAAEVVGRSYALVSCGLTRARRGALFASLFILSAIGHFSSQEIAYAGHHGVPFATVLVPLSGVLALAGGLSILVGYKAKVMVLLGGDAGLRRGEIISLRRCDVDRARRRLHIRFATWYGVEDVPKGGRGRIVPVTAALTAALTANRHLRGPRALHQDDGTPVRENFMHLSPAARESAIRLLEGPGGLFGEIVETRPSAGARS